MATVIQPIITRIDTSTNWRTLNPIPRNGEQCIEDLGGGLFKLKIGDGVTPWISLAYWTQQGSTVSDDHNQTVLNITNTYAKKGEYLNLSTAIAKLHATDVQLGRIITFESAPNKWELFQYEGSDKLDIEDISKWEKLDNKVEANLYLTKIPQEAVIVTYDKKGLVTGYSTIIDGGEF